MLGTLDSEGVDASDRLVWTIVAAAGALALIAAGSAGLAERRAGRAS